MTHILTTFEKNPNFVLKKIRVDEPTGLLQITINSNSFNGEERFQLDPANSWNLIERSFETPSLVGITRWSYGVSVEGVSFPTGAKTSLKYKVAEAPPDYETTEQIVHIKVTDKSAADFRMSAFGLKEPMGMPTVDGGGIRWWMWLILAAGAALTLAFLFRRLKRRYQIPEPIKP